MPFLSVAGLSIPPPSKSVGDYIGRFGKLGYHCWDLKDSVRNLYTSEILPAVLAHLNRRIGLGSSQNSVIVAAYMIGRRATTAAPTILFVSEDVSCRKEAR